VHKQKSIHQRLVNIFQKKDRKIKNSARPPPVQSEIKMDGDGDGSSSGEVSLTVANEGPRSDR